VAVGSGAGLGWTVTVAVEPEQAVTKRQQMKKSEIVLIIVSLINTFANYESAKG
jgi:hypothetical protein